MTVKKTTERVLRTGTISIGSAIRTIEQKYCFLGHITFIKRLNWMLKNTQNIFVQIFYLKKYNKKFKDKKFVLEISTVNKDVENAHTIISRSLLHGKKEVTTFI